MTTVSEEILAEAQRFAERTELLFKQGESARADIVKATSQVEIVRQASKAAALDATLANQELASYWTDDVRTPLAVVDVLDEAPPVTAAGGSAGARPELALLQAQRRGLQAEARGAYAGRYPQGNIALQYGLDANRVSVQDLGYAVILGVTVPILDWSSAASVARQFTMQAEQVQVEIDVARRTYAREYEGALARVQSLYDQIAIARDQVKLSEDNLKLSKLRYEGGEGTALEVVSAQTQLAQSRANLYQTIAAHRQARVDLEAAGGR
jgi:outer membrane protein TolC